MSQILDIDAWIATRNRRDTPPAEPDELPAPPVEPRDIPALPPQRRPLPLRADNPERRGRG